MYFKQNGKSILLAATEKGSKNEIMLLLAAGADVNAQNKVLYILVTPRLLLAIIYNKVKTNWLR